MNLQMNNDQAPIDKVTIKSEPKISPLWILPLIALCLAGWLGYKTYSKIGERIQIHFSNAQGLVEGRTTIRYQGLEVGIVKKISLSDDLKDIYVTADIYPKASQLLSKHTRFWLVKPQASLSGITGLDALVSGNYIAIDPNNHELRDSSKNFSTNYTAFKEEPMDLRSQNGFNLTLTSKDLGSITVGSKIMYRKIPIGEVTNFTLAKDSNSVKIQISIQKQYSHIINSDSRFWNVSGISANIGFNGVDVQLESLNALLTGGIAVDSPQDGSTIEPDTNFNLYSNIKTAGRGTRITMVLPDDSKVSANSPIMYKGIEIGQITDVKLSEDKKSVIASAAIQPAFNDVLNQGSQFVLEEAKFSLTELENVSNLVTGNFLTLVPGIGIKTRQFSVIRKNDLLRTKRLTTAIILISDDTYGLETGTQILYKGIPVGTVSNISLRNDKVVFDAQVSSKYAQLVKSQSRFFVSGSVDAQISGMGLSVTMPPVKRLLAGSISFDSRGDEKINSKYQLYASESLAELAKYETFGSTSLTLFAPSLPPISKGSPILYRNLQVGKVSSFKLVDGGVKIFIRIENRYQHLLTANTVFWNYSGIKVDASLRGINVTASPLMSLIKGGIAFDSINGVENKLNKNWILYEDYKSARQFGRQITLIAKENSSVKPGMPIKYQGVPVGEITLVRPDFKLNNVDITARIFPQYVSNIARQGSQFWVVSPEISLNGAKNIDSLLTPYLQVMPSTNTTANYKFTLDQQRQMQSGTTFYLQSLTKNSVKAGTPILYRDFEVGRVTHVELGDLADRVITTIEINQKYAYLIRKNSVFWDVSGVNVSIGLTGANVKTGTVDNILRGGITFATPEGEDLEPKAEPKTTFLLNKESQPEWLTWQKAIPRS